MSDLKENAALKIQYLLKLNNCKKLLNEFKTLELKSNAQSLSFDKFQKIIIKKEVINNVKIFTESLDKLKKGLSINPRVLITAYMITYFPIDLLGEEKDRHPTDNFILEIANNVVNKLEENNINQIWTILRDFKVGFNNWSQMDKDRTIEKLVVSYYYRCEHLEKINSGELIKKPKLFDPEQEQDMIEELERQKEDIIKSIKLIDRKFDIKYLKENYKQIFNTIQQTWSNVHVNIANTMKKAFYDMLVRDINDGNLISCFNLLKEIGERLSLLCPKNKVASFKNKFTDENLTNILATPEFTSELIKFIGMIIDFISLVDAPVNDETNKQWKQQIVNLLTCNFTTNFPKILIQIEEHIDIIYDLIISMNKD
jgi:hypothetical protein